MCVTLPIFKSHFSIGKSILTLNEPKESSDDSSDSVFDIAQQNNLDKVVLVEDSFMGFLQARKVCSLLSKQLIFAYGSIAVKTSKSLMINQNQNAIIRLFYFLKILKDAKI